MRLILAAMLMLFFTMVAQADTVALDLKLVPQAGNPYEPDTYEIEILLPRSPIPAAVGSAAFLIQDATVVDDDIPNLPQALPIVVSADAIAFYTDSLSLDALYNPFGFGLSLSGGPILSGSLNSPTFNLGTYYGFGSFGAGYTDVLTITSVPNLTVTPEPSSFALLGTGILGMAGVLRRTQRQRKISAA